MSIKDAFKRFLRQIIAHSPAFKQVIHLFFSHKQLAGSLRLCPAAAPH